MVRYAVVSDIHANLEALEAVLDDAGDVDQIWCLGDIVDGGPEPNECLALLRARDAVCIFGNHEEWVVGKDPLRDWSCWTNEHLSPDNLAFLKALPEHAVIGEFTLLHYPHKSLEPPGADDLTRFTSRYCLIGHTHLPLVCRYVTDDVGQASVQVSRGSPDETITLDMERAIMNVGSVGSSLSAPYRACYALIDEPGRASVPTISFRAVPYAVDTFVEKLQACDLPAELAADRRRRFDEPNAVDRRILTAHREWYP